MKDNRKRNCGRNWCSQDGLNQKKSNGYFGRAKTRSKRSLPPSNIINNPPSLSLTNINSVALDVNTPSNSNGPKSGWLVAGITIGSLIVFVIIIYGLVRFLRRSKDDPPSESQQEAGEKRIPRELTINFVRHNHHAPELCTTPDTQPILDYYSSALNTSPLGTMNGNNNSKDPTKSNGPNNNDKSTTVEINKTTTPGESTKPSEENTVNEYVPQYYNGIEIPPLGARIIPLERQVQIAKELTSANLNHVHNKRKSSRISIGSILSINSRRKSNTSNSSAINNNNNGSTTNTLDLIRESNTANESNESNESSASYSSKVQSNTN